MTTEDIYEVGIAMFRYQGIGATGLEAVAEYLHLSKRYLFERFKDKSNFVNSCIRFEIARERATVKEIVMKSRSTLSAIVKLYTHATRYLGSFHPSFFKDLKKYAESEKEFSRYLIMLKVIFNDYIVESVKNGLCTKECDSFLLSGFLCLRLEETMNGSLIHKQEKFCGLTKFVVKSMLLGYVTELGRQQLVEAT